MSGRLKVVIIAGSGELDRVLHALNYATVAADREGNEVSVALEPQALSACKKENPLRIFSPAFQEDAENMMDRVKQAGFPITVAETIKFAKEGGVKIYACTPCAAIMCNLKEEDFLPEIQLVEPDKLVNDIILAADKILRI